jgi:hypothetical protein
MQILQKQWRIQGSIQQPCFAKSKHWTIDLSCPQIAHLRNVWSHRQSYISQVLHKHLNES